MVVGISGIISISVVEISVVVAAIVGSVKGIQVVAGWVQVVGIVQVGVWVAGRRVGANGTSRSGSGAFLGWALLYGASSDWAR